MLTQLQLDVGGTLAFDPTESGRPSAAAVSIVDPSGTALSTPTATVDPVNTTLSASAAAGVESVTVASASSISARRRYLITDADGEREWVRVRSVSGTTVYLLEPLENSFASGATFKGCRITAPVTGAVADELGEGYEARWTYTIDSTSYNAQSRFDVVRSVWPEVIGNVSDLRDYAPSLLRPAHDRANGLAFADELLRASEKVRRDIRARGRDPARFRSYDLFQEVVYEQVLLHLAGQGDVVGHNFTPEAWYEHRQKAYDEALNLALQVTSDYDADQSGTVSPAEKTARIALFRITL